MRQQLVIAAGGLAALALYAALLVSGRAVIRDRESAPAPDFVLETPDPATVEESDKAAIADLAAPPAPKQETAAKGARLPVRTVEPGLVVPPEEDLAQPLERIAPRPALFEPKEKEQPSSIILKRPVALAAGLVKAGDRTVQLKDIEPESIKRVCGSGERSWPCGVVARTAFRNYLRARALACEEIEEKADGTTAATCTVGGENVTVWLVANGWATPRAGSNLEAKAEEARKARLGFHGNDPRDIDRTPSIMLRGESTPGLQPDNEIPN